MLRADVSLPQIHLSARNAIAIISLTPGARSRRQRRSLPSLQCTLSHYSTRGRHDALRNATIRDFVREQPAKLSIIWKYVVCWICAILILYNLRADVRSKHILNAQVSIRSPCC